MKSKVKYIVENGTTTFYLPDGSTYAARGIKNPDVIMKIIEMTGDLSRFEKIALSSMLD